MPVYAFNRQQDNKPTPGEKAAEFGNALSNIYGQYKQDRAAEDQKKLLARLETATPIEKAMIYTQIDPKLGIQYEHEQAQQKVNQQKLQQQEQKNSQLQQLLQSINQRAQGGGQGVVAQDIAPKNVPTQIPGITPQRTQPQPTQTPSEVAARNQPAQQAQQALDIRPEEIVAASALNPAVGRALGDIGKMEQRQEQFKYQKESDVRKETQKYVEKVLDSYQGSKTSEAILGQMDDLSSRGDLTSPLMNNLLGKLGLPLGVLNNPDSEEFDKLANTLTRDIQKFYGARILSSEFNNFLRQIPTLQNSPEGRKRVIENLQKMLLPAKFEYQAYKDILKENAGKRPPNLREQVVERMEPLLDKWSQDFKVDINKSDPSKVPEGTLVIISPDGRRVAVPKEHVAAALSQGGQPE